MAKTVVADLQGVLDLAVKKGETQAVFAERLARAANDETNMSNDDWETLDNETQVWVNTATEAIKRSEAIPLPTGIDFIIPAEKTEEAPAKPSTKAKKEAAPKEEKPAPKEAKKEKAEKPAKVAKETAKENGGAPRGPRGKFAADAKINIVAEKNPFRDGTKCYGWFGKITEGMTVAEAVEAGAPRNHIRWAHTLGHIKIG